MIDQDSPMAGVIDGLKRAEYSACYEFCRRQAADIRPGLAAGADSLGEIAFELECRQPEALLAWSFPEQYEPVECLPAALDAACETDRETVYQLLADAPFADLAATASACAHIKSAATQLARFAHQPPDPQQALFSGHLPVDRE